ncbi:MAG: transglutaminase-like domain-containing protein [bacterium]
MRLALALTVLTLPVALHGQTNTASVSPGPVDIRRFADSVSGVGGSFVRTQRLVHWINDNFTWSATDYVKRTPEQIVAQRQGNCAELASVLRMLLDTMHVRSRWMREINVQPEQTPRRQQTAEKMVLEKGNRASIFGLQHNDHAWLEVWDDATQSWFPADPAYGVVGFSEWLPARLALDSRPQPRVAAVVPIAAEMVVPFMVVAKESLAGPIVEDRSSFYLIDSFARLYQGRLQSLPSWAAWTSAVRTLSPHARAAFDGTENLHQYTTEIGQLKAAYDELTREAKAKGIALQP